MTAPSTVRALALLTALVTGCGGEDPQDPATHEPLDGGSDNNDADARVDDAGVDSAAGEDGGMDEADDGGAASPRVQLPPGSRELDGIVNLVDVEAARALEAYFVPASDPEAPNEGLRAPVNLFLSLYRDEYDIVFFFPDHEVENATFAGQFQHVYAKGAPGGGLDRETRAEGYLASTRLLGAAGVQLQLGSYGPLAHELLHAWANFLDSAFGFGVGRETRYGPHWGFTSVAGELGGFDANTLTCATPDGSSELSTCTKLASGRTRYRVESFYQAGSSRNAYGLLELYLMGLLPANEVPPTFLMLDDLPQRTRVDARRRARSTSSGTYTCSTRSHITATACGSSGAFLTTTADSGPDRASCRC